MYGHQGGKVAAGGGGGVMNWEIGIDMYTLICIRWMTNKNLLYKKKNVLLFKISFKMYAICLIFFLFELLGQILLLNALNKYELILLEKKVSHI